MPKDGFEDEPQRAQRPSKKKRQLLFSQNDLCHPQNRRQWLLLLILIAIMVGTSLYFYFENQNDSGDSSSDIEETDPQPIKQGTLTIPPRRPSSSSAAAGDQQSSTTTVQILYSTLVNNAEIVSYYVDIEDQDRTFPTDATLFLTREEEASRLTVHSAVQSQQRRRHLQQQRVRSGPPRSIPVRSRTLYKLPLWYYPGDFQGMMVIEGEHVLATGAFDEILDQARNIQGSTTLAPTTTPMPTTAPTKNRDNIFDRAQSETPSDMPSQIPSDTPSLVPSQSPTTDLASPTANQNVPTDGTNQPTTNVTDATISASNSTQLSGGGLAVPFDCFFAGENQVCPTDTIVDDYYLDVSISCPLDAVFSTNFIEVTQSGECDCLLDVYDNSFGDQADPGAVPARGNDIVDNVGLLLQLDTCQCILCPEGSRFALGIECIEPIFDNCLSFDCDGVRNGRVFRR